MSTNHCPKCDAPLPPDAPQSLCPRCLLDLGLETTVAPSSGAGGRLPQLGASFGDFRIRSLLGSGGMGAVYEAEDRRSGRHVALKVLSDQLESPEHRHRFLREGRLAASYNHPNSVYIFGTEEIEGTPVIAMELVRGGTLQDRVETGGPLPIGEAVDAVMQMIAGLEAAQHAGVLHRDIKPSNCFVDADGAVKVGDFGLSISTAPRADTFRTEKGAFLGTPAFASPEQLRGDDVDARSDIYSVGVTLFYLLTGKPPFEADQMIKLLATVLERPAPSPRETRAEIPQGLARVVLRCLAKRPEQRYPDYEALRQALLPYTSQAPSPGTLGYRILASMMDTLLLAALAALVPMLWVRDVQSWQSQFDAFSDGVPQATAILNWLTVGGIVTHILYFAVLEGVWGRSVGKLMCGIRVVRPSGEPPGVLRALVRAGIVVGCGILPYWIRYPFDPQGAIGSGDELLPLVASIGLGVALFATVRRRNGFAALHDLASGTRVVRSKAWEHRPGLDVADEPLPTCPDEECIGPYHVLGLVDESRPDLLLAYDARLLRRVWIRLGDPGDTPAARRVSGSGRVRWLGGESSATSRWDAYEAPTGKPFLQLIRSPRPWSEVRFWLLDLAEELHDGQDERSSVWALDRIWITADGRARLLDFPAPGVPRDQSALEAAADVGAPHSPQVLLKQVAISALDGKPVGPQEALKQAVTKALPSAVLSTLDNLGMTENAPLPVDELRSFTQRSATVSLPKRVAIVTACWCVPLLLAGYASLMLQAEREFLVRHPEVGKLAGYLSFYHGILELSPTQNEVHAGELDKAIELVLATDYRTVIEDRAIWDNPLSQSFVDAKDQRLLSDILQRHPRPDVEAAASARQNLAPLQAEIHALGWTANDYALLVSGPVDFLLMATGLLTILAVLPSLFSAVLLGTSPLLRALDIDLVTEQGQLVSRARRVARNAIFWAIVLLAMGLLVVSASFGRPRIITVVVLYWTIKMFLVEQGLPDALVGTRLVPRYDPPGGRGASSAAAPGLPTAV